MIHITNNYFKIRKSRTDRDLLYKNLKNIYYDNNEDNSNFVYPKNNKDNKLYNEYNGTFKDEKYNLSNEEYIAIYRNFKVEQTSFEYILKLFEDELEYVSEKVEEKEIIKHLKEAKKVNSIKLTNKWKNDLELKLLYDIIKKPVQLGGFDIEHVYVKESIFNENNEHLQGIIKIEKNDLCLELILNKITNINIFDYQELTDVTISIENGENDLVFLVKVSNDVVMSISFIGGVFHINNDVKVIF